jgi:hypothetical protein
MSMAVPEAPVAHVKSEVHAVAEAQMLAAEHKEAVGGLVEV